MSRQLNKELMSGIHGSDSDFNQDLDIDHLVLPKGTYFIGDPCYIVPDEYWDAVCDKFDEDVLDIRPQAVYADNGQAIFTMNTKYGDGEYSDQYSNTYLVDAGMIAAVPIMEALLDSYDFEDLVGCGQFVNFDKSFIVSCNDGYLKIGHLGIHTEDDDDSEEETTRLYR